MWLNRSNQGRRSLLPESGTPVDVEMNLFEIEIGRQYKYHHRNGQYFVTVKEKQDGRIGVVLEEKVGTAGDLVEGPQGLIWLRPKDIHPL
jgi:hypothetical protein